MLKITWFDLKIAIAGAVYSFIINIFTYVMVFIAFCAVTFQISGEKAVTGGQRDAENV